MSEWIHEWCISLVQLFASWQYSKSTHVALSLSYIEWVRLSCHCCLYSHCVECEWETWLHCAWRWRCTLFEWLSIMSWSHWPICAVLTWVVCRNSLKMTDSGLPEPLPLQPGYEARIPFSYENHSFSVLGWCSICMCLPCNLHVVKQAYRYVAYMYTKPQNVMRGDMFIFGGIHYIRSLSTAIFRLLAIAKLQTSVNTITFDAPLVE